MPITDEDIVRDLLHRYTSHVQPRDSIATAVIGRQRRRDRNRRLASAVAAGAALATAAGVIAVFPGHASRAPQSPVNALPATRQPVTSRPATTQPALKLTANQRALYKLSAVAARQSAAKGRYAVMMTDGTDIKDTNIIDTLTGDLWGYQLGTNGYPSGGGSVTRHYSPTAAQFAAMPTDPTALRAALIAQWNKQSPALPDPYDGGRIKPLPFTSDDKVFQMANDVLWNPLSGPALRSALFRVLMNVPGVKVNLSAHDANGLGRGDQQGRRKRAPRVQAGRPDLGDLREPGDRRAAGNVDYLPARRGHPPVSARIPLPLRRQRRVPVHHLGKQGPVQPLQRLISVLQTFNWRCQRAQGTDLDEHCARAMTSRTGCAAGPAAPGPG